MDTHLTYPNLEHCEIIKGAGSTTKSNPPDFAISAECLEAMDAPLPELYDFHVEQNVKKQSTSRLSAEEILANIAQKKTRDVTKDFTHFQREAFKKMKSITNASDEACVSILSRNGFKLNDGIERYYRGER
ncbi:hypothetical protein CTEN210_14388 [Chaetoceros tenuissimus]|uniref:Uncharacterized protein n=1 Tax=Chaetoceros tenuissimus TaxID=426638 RepID=A0AAD3D4T9_9STRA|nr:hypothetical protein CTEN210_14388 [Chaetoceros tenuissimus]